MWWNVQWGFLSLFLVNIVIYFYMTERVLVYEPNEFPSYNFTFGSKRLQRADDEKVQNFIRDMNDIQRGIQGRLY
jgi:hypothetical protein